MEGAPCLSTKTAVGVFVRGTIRAKCPGLGWDGWDGWDRTARCDSQLSQRSMPLAGAWSRVRRTSRVAVSPVRIVRLDPNHPNHPNPSTPSGTRRGARPRPQPDRLSPIAPTTRSPSTRRGRRPRSRASDTVSTPPLFQLHGRPWHPAVQRHAPRGSRSRSLRSTRSGSVHLRQGCSVRSSTQARRDRGDRSACSGCCQVESNCQAMRARSVHDRAHTLLGALHTRL